MRRLATPERLRFVLVCTTPWNALTGLAAWRSLDPGRRSPIEVVVVPHPVTGQSVADDVLAEAVDLYDVGRESVRRLPAFPVAGARDLTVAIARSLLPGRKVRTVWISPQEPKSYVIKELAAMATPAARSSGIVLSDDGLSFNKSLLSRSAHYWATGRRALALARPALQAAKGILLARTLVMDARLTPHMDRLDSRQEEVLRQLRHALRPAPGCEIVGDAWFLSQPFEQDSNIPRGQYYGYLERQLESWDRQGIDVRVKLHPREVAGRDGWIPASVSQKALPPEVSGRPIELLLRHKRPRALIGISSTSLLTAAVVGDIPTYSVPPESLDRVEFRWHRAAITDAMAMLKGLRLPPEQLPEVLAQSGTLGHR